ncbi:response regulator transcription factor [Granulosicoccus sp. 3-233]|uniref:response regulator transcription factor n=1 Tax=Granulosicoccus sp. 3-233 TaxID=3417969 RepID=UPI003D3315B4
MVDTVARQTMVVAKQDQTIAVNDRVLVVAGLQSDSDTVCRLLSEAGYSPQGCQNFESLEMALQQQVSADDLLATVICHRTRLTQEKTGVSWVNRPGHLPDQLHGKRIIAVSDCMAEDTVVSLLQEGAHQCFDLHEPPRILQVRLEAALRRHGRLMRKQLTRGDIRFDLEKRRVTRAGKQVDLSPKEFELAYYLFSNFGRVVENGELMTSIWSLPPGMDTRRIDTAACRVRKKLRLAGDHGWQLRRLRCVGYRLINADAE